MQRIFGGDVSLGRRKQCLADNSNVAKLFLSPCTTAVKASVAIADSLRCSPVMAAGAEARIVDRVADSRSRLKLYADLGLENSSDCGKPLPAVFYKLHQRFSTYLASCPLFKKKKIISAPCNLS